MAQWRRNLIIRTSHINPVCSGMLLANVAPIRLFHMHRKQDLETESFLELSKVTLERRSIVKYLSVFG